MKKIETIWHHILNSALEDRYRHTQQELAFHFSYSLSTIHHALNIPTQIGAIRKTSKFFILEDFNKLLFFWASMRNLEKDIVYKTFLDSPMYEIEGMMPAGCIYAGYSAGKKILSEAPADYSKVYFYADKNIIQEAQNRFPINQKREANIFILKMPDSMPAYGQITTIPQTFVDIWNFHDWYAKEFIHRLESKIYAILS